MLSRTARKSGNRLISIRPWRGEGRRVPCLGRGMINVSGEAYKSLARLIGTDFPLGLGAADPKEPEAPMTTLQQVELQCPICETRFRSQTVVSTNSFGGKRTDFHERAAGTQPLPYLIHTCNRCGFSGSERDFTEEVEVSPVLKERVWSELAPTPSTGAM